MNIFFVSIPTIAAEMAPIISSSLLHRNRWPEEVVNSRYNMKVQAEVAKNGIILNLKELER